MMCAMIIFVLGLASARGAQNDTASGSTGAKFTTGDGHIFAVSGGVTANLTDMMSKVRLLRNMHGPLVARFQLRLARRMIQTACVRVCVARLL